MIERILTADERKKFEQLTHHQDFKTLRDAGGWNSLAMPSRYVEAAKIANEGVKLGED